MKDDFLTQEANEKLYVAALTTKREVAPSECVLIGVKGSVAVIVL